MSNEPFTGQRKNNAEERSAEREKGKRRGALKKKK